MITSRDTTADVLAELYLVKNSTPLRLQFISDGGPKETVKLRVNMMLVSVSLVVSRDNFILGSTEGPAACSVKRESQKSVLYHLLITHSSY